MKRLLLLTTAIGLASTPAMAQPPGGYISGDTAQYQYDYPVYTQADMDVMNDRNFQASLDSHYKEYEKKFSDLDAARPQMSEQEYYRQVNDLEYRMEMEQVRKIKAYQAAQKAAEIAAQTAAELAAKAASSPTPGTVESITDISPEELEKAKAAQQAAEIARQEALQKAYEDEAKKRAEKRKLADELASEQKAARDSDYEAAMIGIHDVLKHSQERAGSATSNELGIVETVNYDGIDYPVYTDADHDTLGNPEVQRYINSFNQDFQKKYDELDAMRDSLSDDEYAQRVNQLEADQAMAHLSIARQYQAQEKVRQKVAARKNKKADTKTARKSKKRDSKKDTSGGGRVLAGTHSNRMRLGETRENALRELGR